MKIRNPRMLKCAGWLGAKWLRCWMLANRFHSTSVGPISEPNRPECNGRYIYSFWHEHILALAVKYKQPNIHVLIGMHRDGQLITDIVQNLGFSVVRGSTERKGAVEAVRKMIRLASENQHLAITPDGPRGPRRVAQTGIAYLASKTGLPIVPIAMGYRRVHRAKSWDQFALPKLFGSTYFLFGEPITIPPNLNNDELEIQRLRIQATMDESQSIAEQWAETGKLTIPPKEPETKLADAA